MDPVAPISRSSLARAQVVGGVAKMWPYAISNPVPLYSNKSKSKFFEGTGCGCAKQWHDFATKQLPYWNALTIINEVPGTETVYNGSRGFFCCTLKDYSAGNAIGSSADCIVNASPSSLIPEPKCSSPGVVESYIYIPKKKSSGSGYEIYKEAWITSSNSYGMAGIEFGMSSSQMQGRVREFDICGNQTDDPADDDYIEFYVGIANSGGYRPGKEIRAPNLDGKITMLGNYYVNGVLQYYILVEESPCWSSRWCNSQSRSYEPSSRIQLNSGIKVGSYVSANQIIGYDNDPAHVPPVSWILGVGGHGWRVLPNQVKTFAEAKTPWNDIKFRFNVVTGDMSASVVGSSPVTITKIF